MTPGDAASEATTADAGDGQVTLDAAADAPVSPCTSSTHAFCADFDGQDPFAGWNDTRTDGPLTASTNAVSPPFSLMAQLPRRETTTARSQVSVTFQRSWARTTIEYDLFLEPPAFMPGDDNVGVICVNFRAGASADGACMGRSANGTSWLGTGAPFKAGAWIHAKHVLDPFAKTATVQIDAVFIAGALPVPAGDSNAPAIQVEIGVLGFNAPAPAATMRFDNVTIDFD